MIGFGFFIVFVISSYFFGLRPWLAVLGAGLVGWLLCDINVAKEYTWYSGIWHGLFFAPNFIRHIVWDTPYKADIYTTAYNVWYWIFSILSTVSYFFNMKSKRDFL